MGGDGVKINTSSWMCKTLKKVQIMSIVIGHVFKSNFTNALHNKLWMKKKAKHGSLVQRNDICLTFLHMMLKLAKGITEFNTYY